MPQPLRQLRRGVRPRRRQVFPLEQAPDDGRDDCLLPREEDRLRQLHRRRRDADGAAPDPQRGDRRGSAEEQRHHDRVRVDRSAQGEDGWPRGKEARRGIRRSRLQVPSDGAGVPSRRQDRLADLRGDRRAQAAGGLPQRPLGDRLGNALRRGSAPAELEPDAARGCGDGLPRHADHRRPSVVAVAGRGALARHAQAQHLDRPLGLEPEVLCAAAGAVREHAAQGPDPVRQRLSAHHARPLAEGLRGGRLQGRGQAADPEAERDATLGLTD